MKAFLRIFVLVRAFTEKVKQDSVAAYSAQSAFFIIIAFFPFAMLLLTLLNYIPFTVEEMELFTVDFISPSISGFVNSIVGEIYQKASGAVISVTTITALWSSSKGLLAIVRGLNMVYGVEEKRSYIKLRIVTVFYLLAFIIMLILTLGILVFGGSIISWIKANFPAAANILNLITSLRWLLGLAILILFFMFIYTIIPERKTKFMSELPGAVISAVGWIIFSALYSLYVEHFSNYSYLYGSLTAIVLLMLWLYICMTILFLGAEFNCFIRDPEIRLNLKNWRTEYQADKLLKKRCKK